MKELPHAQKTSVWGSFLQIELFLSNLQVISLEFLTLWKGAGTVQDLLQVGAVTSTHGLRGEVKVFPTTDDPMRYKKLKKVFLEMEMKKQQKELEIERVRFFKNMVIVKFKGIDDINDVQQYKGAKLFVTREDAVPLGEDEYFAADLVGLLAVSDEREELGVVSDVLKTGANDVYVVRQPDGKELLIPAIKDCIQKIDISGGKMAVHLLPGLRDE